MHKNKETKIMESRRVPTGAIYYASWWEIKGTVRRDLRGSKIDVNDAF
jgi:hypothetical protein